jgi:hypothetical protein
MKRSRRVPEHHVELVLETCTGNLKVLSFRELYYGTNRQMASQIAHVLSAVGRNNPVRDIGYYRGRDPLNLLACFPPRAHLRSVTMNRRHPLTDACEFISRSTFRCEHPTATG